MHIAGLLRAAAAITIPAALLLCVRAPQSSAAVPPAAHLDWDYYVTSINLTTAYNQGCAQGTEDKNLLKNSVISLDFGAQASNNAGTYLPLSNTYATYAQVESYAEQYAQGYWICTGSDTSSTVNLAVSTNNSGSYVNSTSGATWGNVVNAITNSVNVHGGQAYIEGGQDFEPWAGGANASFANAKAWISGFSSTTSHLYLDFGSADGCPTGGIAGGSGGACNHGWNQYDEWYVAYGAGPATVTPEIYVSAQAAQWGWISDYGATYQHDVPIYFIGPLDDHYRDSGALTPSAAWTDLYNAVNSHSLTHESSFPFADEQH